MPARINENLYKLWVIKDSTVATFLCLGKSFRTTTVAPNKNDGAYVKIQDADNVEFRGCMLRVLEPAPTAYYGFVI